MNAASDFTPDSQQLLIYSTAAAAATRRFSRPTSDGSNLRRISNSRSIDVEPKMNPKTGADIVFVSDRGGLPQIYRMSSDGTDVVRLTNGEGEAVNPSWNPDGQHIAFAWTRGFDPGNFNIFIMDVASREVVQLTHGEGTQRESELGAGRHALGVLFKARAAARRSGPCWRMEPAEAVDHARQ